MKNILLCCGILATVLTAAPAISAFQPTQHHQCDEFWPDDDDHAPCDTTSGNGHVSLPTQGTIAFWPDDDDKAPDSTASGGSRAKENTRQGLPEPRCSARRCVGADS